MTTVGRATTTWQVDTSRSTAAFRVRNLGVRHVRGTVPVVSGTVDTDSGRVVGLTAVLDATGVDTAHRRRDRDLRSPGLLAVERVPTWSFEGEQVVRDGEGWRVTGALTVRRRCPVVLAVSAATEQGDGTVRVRATTSLDRRDAGVHAPRALVGRRVDVDLDVVLRRVDSRPAG